MYFDLLLLNYESLCILLICIDFILASYSFLISPNSIFTFYSSWSFSNIYELLFFYFYFKCWLSNINCSLSLNTLFCSVFISWIYFVSYEIILLSFSSLSIRNCAAFLNNKFLFSFVNLSTSESLRITLFLYISSYFFKSLFCLFCVLCRPFINTLSFSNNLIVAFSFSFSYFNILKNCCWNF